MTLQQLKYLLAIAEHWSMSKAATELYVSQPSLSNSVKELEKELSINIFERTNRGVNITNEGERLIQHARIILDQCMSIQNIACTKKAQTLRVVGHNFIQPIRAFAKTAQKLIGKNDLDLSYMKVNAYKIVDEIYHENADLGIFIALNRIQKDVHNFLDARHLEFIPLVKTRYYIYIHTCDPLLHNQGMLYQNLKDHVFIHSMERMNESDFKVLFNRCFSFVNLNKRIFVQTQNQQFELIRANKSYGLGPQIAPEILDQYELIQLPVPDTFAEIGYIKRKNKILSEEANLYITALEEELVKLQLQ